MSARVLVIDDGQDKAGLRAAVPSQMEVRHAAAGPEAVQAAAEFLPKVVLLDLDAADLDLVRRVRQLCGRQTTAIVAVARSGEGRLAAYEAGADDFVGDPVLLSELGCKVRRWAWVTGLGELCRLKDEFIDLVREEPYSPFGTIVMALERLRAVPEFQGSRDLLQMLANVELHCEDFVKRMDLLKDYMLWGSDGAPCEPGACLLAELLVNQTEMWRERSLEHAVLLEVGEGMPDDKVQVDHRSVRRVLRWVVNNAITHAAHQVRIVGGIMSGQALYIDVIDDGEGFRQEIVPHLFHGFDPGKNLNMDKGIGLHLSLAHRILKRQGAGISVLDAGPMTTTVRIVLPLRYPRTETYHG